MPDAQQVHQVAVAPGLDLQAVARVDQHHGQVGVRGAGDHVTGVLLVTGRVGDDELAPVGGEIAVGNIDGDALLALGLQAVDKQRQVGRLAGGAVLARVALDGGKLVFEHLLCVVQQPADQRRLAVIDRAAGDEAQKLLGAVLFEVFGNVEIGGIKVGRGHQKYPCCFLASIDAPASLSMARPWRSEPASLSMARPWRSDERASSISRMMSLSVVAPDSTAPVSG